MTKGPSPGGKVGEKCIDVLQCTDGHSAHCQSLYQSAWPSDAAEGLSTPTSYLSAFNNHYFCFLWVYISFYVLLLTFLLGDFVVFY